MTEPTGKTHQQLRLWEFPWVRDLLIVLAVLTVLALIYVIRSVTAPIVAGLALAYVFNPLVTALHRRWRWPRWLSTAGILFLGFFVLLVAALYLSGPVVQQAQQALQSTRLVLTKQWNRLSPQMGSWQQLFLKSPAASDPDATPAPAPAPPQTPAPPQPPAPTAESSAAPAEPVAPEGPDIEVQAGLPLADAPPSTWDHALALTLVDQLGKLDYAALGRLAARWLGAGVGTVGSVINTTSYLMLAGVIVCFCFFFFSWHFGPILEWFDPLIPRSQRQRTLEILRMMDATVAAFIRGRLIQALVMGVVLSLGWWLAGVPYWLLLGLCCGLLNLIPYAAALGWLTALVLAAVHAVGAEQSLLFALLWPTVVYVAAQLFDGWVVEPWVQGQATDLDPLTVLLVVLMGGALAGLLGMLLAIPLAACVKILGREILIPRLREYAASR